MFVLMDMQIYRGEKKSFPTQIGAVRVDSQLNALESFSTVIRPEPRYQADLENPSFGGFPEEMILNSQGIRIILENLNGWFRTMDLLLWWDAKSESIFRQSFQRILDIAPPDSMIIRTPVLNHLGADNRRADVYTLCEERNIPVQMPQHRSRYEVDAFRQLLLQTQVPLMTITEKTRNYMQKKEKSADAQKNVQQNSGAKLVGDGKKNGGPDPKNTIPVFRSITSKKKVVHLETCRFIHHIPEEKKIGYQSYSDAKAKGCRFCKVCSTVKSRYLQEEDTIHNYSMENHLDCKLAENTLHIRSVHDYWRIIADPETGLPKLYHRNRRINFPPEPSEIPQYHLQKASSETLIGMLQVIRNHDLYREKSIINARKKSKKTLKKEARSRGIARVLVILDELKAVSGK